MKIKLAKEKEKNIETKSVKYNKINIDVFQQELKNRFSVLYNEEQELNIGCRKEHNVRNA